MDKDMAKATVEGRQRSNEMFEFLSDRLNTLQRAEAFFNKFDYDQLTKIEGIIKNLKLDKEKEFRLQQQAEAKRHEAEQKIREMAAEHGIDLGEISPAKKTPGAKTGKKRNIDPEKYAIKYKGDAKVYFWSGSGHAPKPFKDAMDRGYKKEDCLNPKTGNVFEISLKQQKAA